MKYFLPCECGERVIVERGQAGQVVNCACGAELNVPTMRGLRQLDPISDTPVVATSGWSVGRGLTFASAFVVMLVALAYSAYCFYGVSQIRVGRPDVPFVQQQSDAQVENMTVQQVWGEWRSITERGLGRYQVPQFVINREVVALLQLRAYLALAVGLVALAVAVATSLVGRGKQ